MVNISDFYSAAAHQDFIEASLTDKEIVLEVNLLVEAPEITNKVPSKCKGMTSTAPLLP